MADVAAPIRAALAQQAIDGFVAAVHAAGSRGSLQFKALAQSLAANAVPENLRIRVHEDLGRAAQQATIEAYQSRPGASEVAPYRIGTDPRRTRFAGGMLLRALQAAGFYEATANSIAIINMDILDQEARQWKRLNFGAGSAGGRGPGEFAVELLQASIGLEADRRPAFGLPPGFWIQNGERVAPGEAGTAQFFPRRVGSDGKLNLSPDHTHPGRGRPNGFRMTRGIAATNFLDAGVRSIAENIAPSYLSMYREFFRSQAGKTHFEKINVIAPRPRTFNFSGYK